MVDSDRMMTTPAESVAETASEHPVTTGISVVSGGLAGAVIGNMVGGRLGAAIGAVVGGVAGVALSHEAGDSIEHAVEDATQKVKATAAEVKPQVQQTVDRVKETVHSTQTSIQEQMSPGTETAATEASANIAAPTSLAAPPVSVDDQYEQGLTLGKQGNLVGAIAAFQAVIEQEPDYAEAHYNLGVVLGRHGLQEQGIEHIQRAQALCRAEGRDREAHNIEQILQRLGAA